MKGRDVVIVDDLVDTGGTITSLSTRLKAAGAKHVYVCASHGLFNQHSCKAIEESAVDKVFVLDTLPFPPGLTAKVVEVSIAQQLAQVILKEHFRSVNFQEETFEIDD